MRDKQLGDMIKEVMSPKFKSFGMLGDPEIRDKLSKRDLEEVTKYLTEVTVSNFPRLFLEMHGDVQQLAYILHAMNIVILKAWLTEKGHPELAAEAEEEK